MLNNDLTYKQLMKAFSPYISAYKQLNKAIAFYSAYFPEKITSLNTYKGLLRTRKLCSSIPDDAGISLGLLEFDVTNKYLCKKLYKELAQTLHPDKGGNKDLFDFCYKAYKVNDFNTLKALHKYSTSSKSYDDVQSLLSFAKKRTIILLEYLKSLDAFKLLVYDISAGRNGCNLEAKNYMEKLLDKSILEAQTLLCRKTNENSSNC